MAEAEDDDQSAEGPKLNLDVNDRDPPVRDDDRNNFMQAFGGPLFVMGSYSEQVAIATGFGFGPSGGRGNGNYYGGLRADTSVIRPSVQPGGFDPYAASKYLRDNETSNSRHICAQAVRMGCEQGGINTVNHPINARDYNADIMRDWGFNKIASGHGMHFDSPDYHAQVGDIVVLSANHIAMMCDDGIWRADFPQRDMYGGSQFRLDDCNFNIYRHNTLTAGETQIASNKVLSVNAAQPSSLLKAKSPAAIPITKGA